MRQILLSFFQKIIRFKQNFVSYDTNHSIQDAYFTRYLQHRSSGSYLAQY